MPDQVHIFGIRHHGPGSARSLRQALDSLKPDIVLIEGPPEADPMIPLAAHESMRPPVALLVYVPDAPRHAVFYPFAVFSPEWQALQYAHERGIPARFIDLPHSVQLAEKKTDEDAEPTEPRSDDRETEPTPDPIASDPLGALAEAAGYSDGERWWEHLVEQRRDNEDVFAAILEAITEVRKEARPVEGREARREAHMRKSIRLAQRELFDKIAVVCGAWHAPALATLGPASKDNALLSGLPTVKVAATWIPWTNHRLTNRSGYGAGIESPGWYEHLWTYPDHIAIRWMSRVGQLMRREDLDGSPAHAVEAVRLAETLAALRGRPLAGLPEMNEAVQSVYCLGSDVPMRLIAEELIVGKQLGQLPDETPMVPLQRDLTKMQKRLRLPMDAAWKDYDLDLRKPTDLERSHLLHRLTLLGIAWGREQRSHGAKGTFHEIWRLSWDPEHSVQVIEAGLWGNTVADAAGARTQDDATRSTDLPSLTRLLRRALLADLPVAIRHIMQLLEGRAALATDLAHLMGAVPPLADIVRYGNVRGTDSGTVRHVVDGLVERIAVGLTVACSGLADDAAEAMFDHIGAVDSTLPLLQSDDLLSVWRGALARLLDLPGIHGLIAGRTCRLLLDSGVLSQDEASRRAGLALSRALDPAAAAAWLEGLLKGSGALLIHDDSLWSVVDRWLTGLSADDFQATLPLVRRTFATFTGPDRRQMGERVRSGPAAGGNAASPATDIDWERAERVLPILRQILGIVEP